MKLPCIGKIKYKYRPSCKPVVLNRAAICVSQGAASYCTLFQCFSTPVCRERFPGVPRKILEKNYLGMSNFAVFAREINKIWSVDRFYLKTDFEKEIDKREREFR